MVDDRRKPEPVAMPPSPNAANPARSATPPRAGPVRAARVRNRVVCGVEHSVSARSTAALASCLARQLGAELVLVHVARIRLSALYGNDSPTTTTNRFEAAGTEAVRRGSRLLQELADDLELCDAELRVEIGDPWECLLALARDRATAALVVDAQVVPWASALVADHAVLALVRDARCQVAVASGAGVAERAAPVVIRDVNSGRPTAARAREGARRRSSSGGPAPAGRYGAGLPTIPTVRLRYGLAVFLGALAMVATLALVAALT